MSRFDFRHAVIGELKRSAQMATALEQIAGVVRDAVEQAAPERLRHYKDSLEATSGVEGGEVIGRVLSTDFKAVWIEKGTGPHRTRPTGTPAFAPMRRGAESVGLTVTG